MAPTSPACGKSATPEGRRFKSYPRNPQHSSSSLSRRVTAYHIGMPRCAAQQNWLAYVRREQGPGRYVFVSERGAPMSTAGFRRMVERLGKAAKMPFSIHPHMLRHATGFKLANQGVDTRSLQQYLGHKNIQHTVRYTELSAERFRDFGRPRPPRRVQKRFRIPALWA